MISDRRTLTGTVFTSMFFLGIVISIVGAAARNIGLTPAEIGFLLSTQNVGFMIGILLAGWFGVTTMKSRVMMWGSILLSAAFSLFYALPSFGLNLFIMLCMGAGIGLYEGTSDSILMDLYDRNESLYISINHLFVTFGSLIVTLYLVYLQMSWRRSMVQSAIAVGALFIVFAVSRSRVNKTDEGVLSRLSRFAGKPPFLIAGLLLFLCVGSQLTIQGVITTYLMGYRGHDQVTSKLVAASFLVGVVVGRAAIGYITRRGRIYRFLTGGFFFAALVSTAFFFVDMGPFAYVAAVMLGLASAGLLPLCITLAGLLYRENAGMAVGLIKLAIPTGGIVGPLLFSALSLSLPFTSAVALFPAFYLAGGMIALLSGKKLETG